MLNHSPCWPEGTAAAAVCDESKDITLDSRAKVHLILHLKQEFISYSISSLSLGEKVILAIIPTNSFTS